MAATWPPFVMAHGCQAAISCHLMAQAAVAMVLPRSGGDGVPSSYDSRTALTARHRSGLLPRQAPQRGKPRPEVQQEGPELRKFAAPVIRFPEVMRLPALQEVKVAAEALTIPEQFLRQPWQAARPWGQQADGGTSMVQVTPHGRTIPRASRAVPARQRHHHRGGARACDERLPDRGFGSLINSACSPKPGW